MKKTLLLWILCLPAWGNALYSPHEILHRFTTWQQWFNQLPITPDSAFLARVDEQTPLAEKLRNKWLYEVARLKNWKTYQEHYQPTDDVALQCYALTASYYLGQTAKALAGAEKLWLSGHSQPPSCTLLLDIFTHSTAFTQALRIQRIALALEQRNTALARFLLTHYSPILLNEERLLNDIIQNPTHITRLTPSPLHALFYAYGLHRILIKNTDTAIALWQQPASSMLTPPQHQAFLKQVAIYKALRNHEDTITWFDKIHPAFYSDTLLDWRIRFALKHEHWQEILRLIPEVQDKDLPWLQYWRARALEATNQRDKAIPVYRALAQKRHYYGFLASFRLHQQPVFDAEKAHENLRQLQPYASVLQQIQTFYRAHETQQAARLLHDFASELPKTDYSALTFWVASVLNWHAEAVSLSNRELLSNQLSLRFPLAYAATVQHQARDKGIDPAFIYAIMRQESEFRETAHSSVGALGLMQLLPSTAKSLAKQITTPYRNPAQLLTPPMNITLGATYLRHLAKRFENHPVLIAAAYNAGPHQVNYWLKNHPPKAIDIWIDTLPWQETRNYLKNVMAFYTVYQYRLGQKPDLTHWMQPLM